MVLHYESLHPPMMSDVGSETHSLVAVKIIPAVNIIIVVYFGGIIVTKECKKLQWI